MRLAFFVPRKGSLKAMGALIRAAIERGHAAVLVWDPDEPKPGEAVTEAHLQPWPEAFLLRHPRRAPLLPALRTHGVEALIGSSLHSTLRAFGHDPALPELLRAGIRLYSVDYVTDTLTSDPASYRVLDVTFYMSEHQRELHWCLHADGFARVGGPEALRARSAVSGSTMLDQLAVVDRAAVRKRYGLGEDQPVVVLMSLKMTVPDPWRRLVWGRGWRGFRAARAVLARRPRWVPQILRGHGYRELVEATRRLCRREGAAFVVKSRAKNEDPPFVRRAADVFVYDEGVYPYTSMELMAVASLCVHFQSGAVLESAFVGVPSLSIRVSQSHLEHYVTFDEVFGGRPGSLQNFAGVVTLVEHDEAARTLDALSLATARVDPAARARYVEKFLGFDDTRASERVLEVIEARRDGLEEAAPPPHLAEG